MNMRIFVKGVNKAYWQPLVQSVRSRSHVNVTRPRPSHFARAIIENICKPYFSLEKSRPKYIPNYEKCTNITEKEPEKIHPLEIILAEKAKNLMDNSKLIAFFHKNSIEEEDLFQYKLILKKNGMQVMNFGKKIMTLALSKTIYEPVLVLYQSHTIVILSPESNIPRLLSVQKKMPKFVLLAAVVENKFLSVSELQHYGTLPNLETARAEFVGVLSSASQSLIQKINHHSNSIIQVLSQHQELNKEKS